MEEAIKAGWSSRQLERQISTLYYKRLLASRDQVSVIAEAQEKLLTIQPESFIKDPYVLDFLDLKNYPALRESDLEQALIDKLQEFLLELGRGFCFVARQKLMRYEDEDFYLDLVFYHSVLKCHVLIDLKIGKLTHGDVGQMDSYHKKYIHVQNPPIDIFPPVEIILRPVFMMFKSQQNKIMTTALNLFLRASIRENGIPFELQMEKPKKRRSLP